MGPLVSCSYRGRSGGLPPFAREFPSEDTIAVAYTYAYASSAGLAWTSAGPLVEYATQHSRGPTWSDYFTLLLSAAALMSASLTGCPDGKARLRAVTEAAGAMGAVSRRLRGADAAVKCSQIDAYQAWEAAPRVAGIPIVADLPALGIVFLITVLVYIGIRESKTASNIMVAIKLAIILLVIILGAFYVNTANWNPFMPNGFGGMMTGVAAVFFAYIGFDALSTTAEECRDPYKNLPRGMIYSLLICTVLYVPRPVLTEWFVHQAPRRDRCFD